MSLLLDKTGHVVRILRNREDGLQINPHDFLLCSTYRDGKKGYTLEGYNDKRQSIEIRRKMMGDNGNGTVEGRWPWPEDGWTKRIEAIKVVLEESIAMAKSLEEERKRAIADSPPSEGGGGGSDYNLLSETYRQGALAHLFERDSEMTRIQLGRKIFENMAAFLDDVDQELTTIFSGPFRTYLSEAYVYSHLLSKISTDINIVQQALLQRRLNQATDEIKYQHISHQGYVLQVAGVLANATLTRVRECGLLPLHVMPLTYLQDRIDIRLIPYFDVVILSIPYGAMNSDCNRLATDYLAIPHEIGHYLYWWGQFVAWRRSPATPIREFLEQATAADPIWVKTWLEEIFADAVGCMIAGPVSVLGFQELMTSSSPELLRSHFHDDHAHPFPALRPFIQTAFLRKLTLFPSAAEALDETWNDWVKENWPGLDDPLNHIYQVGDGELMRGEQIINYLAREGGLFDQILRTLRSLQPNDELDCWTGNQSLESMYDHFTEGVFLAPEHVKTAELPQRSDSRFIRERRMEQGESRLREIFNGWATEGPHGNDPGI